LRYVCRDILGDTKIDIYIYIYIYIYICIVLLEESRFSVQWFMLIRACMYVCVHSAVQSVLQQCCVVPAIASKYAECTASSCSILLEECSDN
jgi:hypothetical protein